MIKKNRNAELREELLRLGVHKDQIDLFISIYTANKPFARSKMPDHEPLGDIIICNEKATEKPEIRGV
jgi:ssRNA-specific RNase YbeY (16S rRNA maturation enzyme)